MPGSGKSQIVKNYDPDCLFVVCYNELGLTLKKEGYKNVSTFNQLFSLNISDEKNKNQKHTFNIENYETIFFDEQLLHCRKRQKMISNFIKNNPDKIIIGAGDLNQIEAISKDTPEQIEKAIDIAMKNQILLKENKRMLSEKDKKTLKELKDDIFINNFNIRDIINKYKFKTIDKIDDVETVNNIAYFNNTCNRINKHVHYNILKNDKEYYEGQIIKAIERIKLKSGIIQKRYVYKITKISNDGQTFKILDEFENIEYDNLTLSFIR